MAGAQPGSSSNQYVVVWEWYHDSFGWRPYSPYVSQVGLLITSHYQIKVAYSVKLFASQELAKLCFWPNIARSINESILPSIW